ncbi:MAG: hypothetical protein IV100_15635 [Myxococcales bacterium]|nr:hypothetical protein [Myxococcales bacterium]
MMTVLLLGLLGTTSTATPYAHDGTAALPIDGKVVRARALFDSTAADRNGAVLVWMDLVLPSGGEGFLTIELTLAPVGDEAPATFDYYEKTGPGTVSFSPSSASGRVVIGDRFEYGDETSLYIEFDATFSDGKVTRRIDDAWAVTAPSPAILRSQGRLPSGAIVIDDGSGAFTGRGYARGTVDCYGYPEETYYVETYHDDYVVEDDPDDGITDDFIFIEPDDGVDSGGGDDAGGLDDGLDGVTDDYGDYSAPSGGVNTVDDGPACGSEDTTSSSSNDEGGFPSCSDDSDSSSSSDSSGNSGCSGDAEASTGSSRSVRFAFREHRLPPLWARRVLALSPLLIALAVLLGVREWRSVRVARRSR